MADNKPRFSAGLVVGIVLAFWIVVFGSVIVHGMNGLAPTPVVVQSK